MAAAAAATASGPAAATAHHDVMQNKTARRARALDEARARRDAYQQGSFQK